jgi:polyphosphate kinase
MDAPAKDLRAPEFYASRQLSWLDFDRRLLELAQDPDRALADRLRFLVLSAENLDGFFRKRLDALRREVELGYAGGGPWPHTPSQELAEISVAAREMMRDQRRFAHEVVLPALAERGVRVVDVEELPAADRAWLSRYFEERLFPILTPLAVDPGRPFPYISNLSLSLAVVLRHEADPPLFARVKVPTNQPRWITCPESGCHVALEDVIGHHLGRLFAGLVIVGWYPFRVTRSTDVPTSETDAEDLMDFAQEVLRERRFARVVRLEVDARMPLGPRELLVGELGVPWDAVFDVDGLLALDDLARLPGLAALATDGEPFVGRAHPAFAAADDPAQLFARLRAGDVLVHHPYHDYALTVGAFMRAAATDPQVRAIKQSLYRTSKRSETLDALIAGAERDKEVTVLLELKARLDEEANIAWARRLEQSGIDTSYGFVGLKTHTRLTLVVREEDHGLQPYVHVSTGDYNSVTAREYSDLGLFTARADLGRDVIDFCNFLTGYTVAPDYRELIVAPQAMRQHFLDAIEHEIRCCQAGGSGRIVAMMNALADVPLIAALYRASQAGVSIDLIIRRECGLRPGVPGVSESIRVRSVLGVFLEHARVFWFGAGGANRVYLGSADWMYRNLDSRIEAVVPVADPAIAQQLIDLLGLYLADTAGAWELGPDGAWRRVRPQPGEAPLSVQERLMRDGGGPAGPA